LYFAYRDKKVVGVFVHFSLRHVMQSIGKNMEVQNANTSVHEKR
jgi:hypothetical protein